MRLPTRQFHAQARNRPKTAHPIAVIAARGLVIEDGMGYPC